MTHETHTIKNTALMSNSLYFILKNLVQLMFPAFVVLYFVFNLPNAKIVLVVTAVITIFFGMLLNVGTKAYNFNNAKYDGYIAIQETEDGRKIYSLELNGDPEEIDTMKSVTFKVGAPTV